jgi:hypothetical protein
LATLKGAWVDAKAKKKSVGAGRAAESANAAAAAPTAAGVAADLVSEPHMEHEKSSPDLYKEVISTLFHLPPSLKHSSNRAPVGSSSGKEELSDAHLLRLNRRSDVELVEEVTFADPGDHRLVEDRFKKKDVWFCKESLSLIQLCFCFVFARPSF